jgi:hypothetical protein
MKSAATSQDAVLRNNNLDATNICSGEVDFYIVRCHRRDHNTTNRTECTSRYSTEAPPPPTSLETQTDRALSTSNSPLATHRKASPEASGRSLKAVDAARRPERFAGVAITSDPERWYPKTLSAKSA